jgi:NAD-dependent DNA ligase
MDMGTFGSQTGDLLIEQGLITNIADIYSLKRDDLLVLEGFKEKKVDNLLAGIEASKKQPAERLLTGLGVRFVGISVSKLLLDSVGGIDELAVATQARLEEIAGIGPQTAAGVVAWFADERNQALLAQFRAAGLIFSAKKVDTGSALVGKTFVVTGTLPTLSRSDVKKLIEGAGGKVTSAVSSKTDYLVAGENAGSKLTKAQQLGTTILTESELQTLIMASNQPKAIQMSLL